MSNPPRESDPDWRAEALSLGVDPDEPDDYHYWSDLHSKRNIINSFRYHQPSPEQIERIAEVRRACITCAMQIMRSTARCGDQTVALRKLHEAMMTANKSIVCEAPKTGA